MTDNRLDPKYLEDLSEYHVAVTVKRPYFYRDMVSAVFRCEGRFKDGDILAVYDALLLCELGGLPLPMWLSHAVRDLVVDALTGGVRGSRGRGNSPLPSAMKELKKQAHYRLVMICQRISKTLEAEKMVANILTDGRKEAIGNLSHVFPPVILELVEDPKSGLTVEDFDSTLSASYIAVSKILRGTFAQAEPRSIRASYKAVQKAVDAGGLDHVGWFATAEPETLKAFGMQADMNDAEMSAWEMGQQYMEPVADRGPEVREIFSSVGKLTGMAKKP
ncbi:MAG: hypothetical protein ACI9TZ_003223 [Yoonia sp.]|jgi:hypothetical protein